MAKRKRKLDLTTADLVVLSLFSERPMHGYEANLELERREIRDWAGISRPQVYYSLDKLQSLGFLRTKATKKHLGKLELTRAVDLLERFQERIASQSHLLGRPVRKI